MEFGKAHVRVVPVHTGTFRIYTRRFFLRAKPRHTHLNTHQNTHHTHTKHTHHDHQQHHDHNDTTTTHGDRQTETEKVDRERERDKRRQHERQDERQDEEEEKTRRKTRQEKIKRSREDQDEMCCVCGCVFPVFLFKITRPSNNFEFFKITITNPERIGFSRKFVVCEIVIILAAMEPQRNWHQLIL